MISPLYDDLLSVHRDSPPMIISVSLLLLRTEVGQSKDTAEINDNNFQLYMMKGCDCFVHKWFYSMGKSCRITRPKNLHSISDWRFVMYTQIKQGRKENS